MNKKFFRIALLCALLGTGAAVTSCTDYDQEIADLQEQVTALDKKVSDLQSAINAGSVITGVSTSAAGVTVTLSNGQTFNLTNGKDGANGANGADGKTYVPNVETGTFFLNGEDTGISYLVGGVVKATLDENGNLVLEGLEASEEPVVLSLTNDLKSLAFIPGKDADAAEFFTLTAKVNNKDQVIAASQETFAFRLNPSNVKASAYAYSFINRDTKVAGDNTDFLTIVGEPVAQDGALYVTATAKTLDYEFFGQKVERGAQNIALQATSAKGDVVTSDYLRVAQPTQLKSDPTHNRILRKEVKGVRPEFRYELVYNATTAINDLETIDAANHNYDKLFGVVYTVSFKKNDKGQAVGNTDNAFVLENGVISVNAEKFPGKSALGKVAYVVVTATVNGVKVAESETTVTVVNEPVKQEVTIITLDAINTTYNDILVHPVVNKKEVKPEVKVSFAEIAKKVDGGITLEAFKEMMLNDFTVAYLEADGVTPKKNFMGQLITVPGLNYNKANDALTLSLDNSISENTAGVYEVVLVNTAAKKVAVQLPYTVTFDWAFPEYDANLVKENTIFSVAKTYVNLSNVFEPELMTGTTMTWYLPHITGEGTPAQFAKDFFGNVSFGTYPDMSKDKDAKSQNASLDGTSLTHNGAIAADETIFLDAVYALPNGSKKYFPCALEAEFVNPFALTVSAVSVESIRDKQVYAFAGDGLVLSAGETVILNKKKDEVDEDGTVTEYKHGFALNREAAAKYVPNPAYTTQFSFKNEEMAKVEAYGSLTVNSNSGEIIWRTYPEKELLQDITINMTVKVIMKNDSHEQTVNTVTVPVTFKKTM